MLSFGEVALISIGECQDCLLAKMAKSTHIAAVGCVCAQCLSLSILAQCSCLNTSAAHVGLSIIINLFQLNRETFIHQKKSFTSSQASCFRGSTTQIKLVNIVHGDIVRGSHRTTLGHKQSFSVVKAGMRLHFTRIWRTWETICAKAGAYLILSSS